VRFQSRFPSLAEKEGAGRRLLPALCISIALHVLMLWPDALPRMALQASQPLTATLRLPRSTEPAAIPLAAKAEAKPAAGVRPAAHAVPAQPLAAPATESASAAVTSTARAADALSGGAANPVAQPGETASFDADGIRAYRIVLAREAKAHRRYPPLARERGWTGTAEVSVDVSREGRARHILLARSSGHEVLDREAVNMMSRAAASAALPDSLRGREFAVRLPVVFDFSEIQ
jgi:protein TonB